MSIVIAAQLRKKMARVKKKKKRKEKKKETLIELTLSSYPVPRIRWTMVLTCPQLGE
jgi:hypothetical protein